MLSGKWHITSGQSVCRQIMDYIVVCFLATFAADSVFFFSVTTMRAGERGIGQQCKYL